MSNLAAILDTLPERAPVAPYVVPKNLIPWVAFIRVCGFQGRPAGDIAAALQAQGVPTTAADVQAVIVHHKGRRHPRPVKELLDVCRTDIDKLRAAGVSESRVCLWLAIHRGLAVHQCQLNEWARMRRSDGNCRHNVP